MTPKEKASELISIFDNTLKSYQSFLHSKECAINCAKQLQLEGDNYIKFTSHNMNRYKFYEDVINELYKVELQTDNTN